MVGHEHVQKLFNEYNALLEPLLRAVFEQASEEELYHHLAYFMGFRDAALLPISQYGGKRFRSGLALMIADWYEKKEEALPAALSIELFHNFTLIHDDIVDNDALRRGRPTVWKLWGIPHAINDGDAQMILSLEAVLASDLEPRVVHKVTRFLLAQYRRVIEGQYQDFMLTALPLMDAAVNEAAYFKMIERKTADLIIASCCAPGLIAGATESELESLRAVGLNLGLAYQVCDDVVSIWGESKTTGKMLHSDIIERKKTLPILYAYEQLGGADQETLASLYTKETSLTDVEVSAVIDLLESVDTYREMHSRIDALAEAAYDAGDRLSISKEQKKILRNVVKTLLPEITHA